MRFLLSVPAIAVLTLLISGTAALAFPGGQQVRGELGQHGSVPPGVEPPSGKVSETMDSGGYTYVNLKKDTGGSAWVATPKISIKVGDDVVFQPGQMMYDYKSPTLNRTFETIIFSPGIMALPGTKADKQVSAASGAAEKIENVSKATGAGASTVEGCYKDSAKLDGKNVTVRGKVVKVSPRIMGANWVHIQDGTGDASKGTHNLVVTTQEMPATGDVVTATGTLAKDKDFGYGYKYDVIVEKATISK